MSICHSLEFISQIKPPQLRIDIDNLLATWSRNIPRSLSILIFELMMSNVVRWTDLNWKARGLFLLNVVVFGVFEIWCWCCGLLIVDSWGSKGWWRDRRSRTHSVALHPKPLRHTLSARRFLRLRDALEPDAVTEFDVFFSEWPSRKRYQASSVCWRSSRGRVRKVVRGTVLVVMVDLMIVFRCLLRYILDGVNGVSRTQLAAH